MAWTRLPSLSAVSHIIQKVCVPICTPPIIDSLLRIEYLEQNDYNTPVTGALSSNLRYGYVTQNAYAANSFRSRHSPRLRVKAFAKSAIGFRDQFAFQDSQQATSSTCPFPGLNDNIQQRSQTANIFARREPSPLALCTDETLSDDPFTFSPHQDQCDLVTGALLVPALSFIPDARVLDAGCHNFWVAVEVSTRLHRPGQDNRDSSKGVMTRSRRSSCSVELGE